MSGKFDDLFFTHRPLVEAALRTHLPLSHQRGAERLNEAIQEAVFPGGKRFRPLLTLLGARLVGGDFDRVLPVACAVEFLHTSSIILDDLPAMDDADWRRGRLALHCVYGESIALLAALALLNQAYALFARAAAGAGEPARLCRLLAEATDCIGVNGMIGGQAADLDAELRGQEAVASRSLKTTSLIRLTLSAGAIVCGASEAAVAALTLYGEGLGVAYQVRDDLLDELGDAKVIGKPVKQDERHQRASYLTELGVEGAREMAFSLVERGRLACEEQFGERPEARLLTTVGDLLVREIESCAMTAPASAD